MAGFVLRVEEPQDANAIDGVIARAFAGHPHSDGSEPRIVRDLRTSGALSLSLVAVERGPAGDERVVGHVAFSPVGPSDGTPDWYGLAPISVEPDRQRAGIGAALIREGLARLRARAAAGCVVFGEPAYYERFGFAPCPALAYPGGPAAHFRALAFAGALPRGTLDYHAALARPGRRRIAIVYPGDRAARAAATPGNNRFADLFQAFAAVGIHAEPAVWHDDLRDEVRAQLLALDAALVWVNPIEGGRDRRVLDDLLREVAAAGVFVSTHPDTILALGTKEVVYRTRSLGWGSDVHRVPDLEALRRDLPERLDAGPRVLKQIRGHSGQGVFKVERVVEPVPAPAAGDAMHIRIRHAQRGSPEEEVSLGALCERLRPYFEAGGAMIDQAYQPRLVDGTIRAYLVGGLVVGFGLQAINGLHPAPPDAPPGTVVDPGPRLYHPPSLPEGQRLKRLLESEWIPAAQRLLGIAPERLPILWDCDFLYGPRDAEGADTYVLCEINVSSVAPYPPSAVPVIVEAVSRRLGLTDPPGTSATT